MKHSKQEIADLFSNGKFENIMDYLSDEIVWNVIGENIFEGKNAVKENCENTSKYFKSVQTDFKTNDILVSDNKVIIIGTRNLNKTEKEQILFLLVIFMNSMKKAKLKKYLPIVFLRKKSNKILKSDSRTEKTLHKNV